MPIANRSKRINFNLTAILVPVRVGRHCINMRRAIHTDCARGDEDRINHVSGDALTKRRDEGARKLSNRLV
ncbi:protein of unknown function [Denitratisoma oestradiolicum]|uniref:Uncharacterized protein n=1 Tax=Denitratisoma oestradiolicum TaxID=311182 RepID=A0A6S6Y0D3_9PROT|nr:protein of unknown function [Denitratisoma oestradiolicum]